MRLKTLYEDSDFLVIDKPSGIFVHPSTVLRAGPGESTVLDLMKKKYPGIQLSHRLDKETSGVLVLAKNEKAHQFLKKQFSAPALEIAKRGLADRQPRVKKTYIAIVDGWVKNDRGIINKPIGRSPKDFRRRLAGRGVKGKIREAITEYKVLKRFQAPFVQNFSRLTLPRVRGGTYTDKNFEQTAPFTFLEIRPKTGRTHQIRVHMKFLNHPVACDSLYNPKGACPAGLHRLALHAKSIEFKNLDGKTIKVEAALPKEFKKIVS